MTKSVVFKSFILSTSLFAVLLGCTKKETLVESGIRDKVFHLGNGAAPKDLDPQIVTGVPESRIMYALFEGLVMADPKTLAPIPGVAESWEVSNNGLTYTFKLNKNAKWHNGDTVTAHDFVYSWMRELSPGLGAEYAYTLFVLKNGEAFNKGEVKDFSQVGVKAIDDHTLKVDLAGPTPYFLKLLSHQSTFPVHKATIEKFGKMETAGTKWTRAGNHVGNGPFQLSDWQLNKVIKVKKYAGYWDAAKVRLNEIHFYAIPSIEVEERTFRAGQLHATYEVGAEKIAYWKKKENSPLRITAYLGTYYYRMNVTRPPLDNLKVRKALSMSIDREAITKYVTKAGQIPTYSFVPPNTGGYNSRHKVEGNVEKAKKLLAEAGYPEGKGFPKIEILYNTLELHQSVAEAIQQMWKKNLGINVVLTNQEWKVYLDSQRKLNYYLSRAGWIGDYTDPNTFMDMWVTNGGNNQTGWSNKEYDRLIAQAAVTGDEIQRMELFQQAEKILLEEQPVLPIYTYVKKRLFHPSVKGWERNVLDLPVYKNIYLEASK